MAGNSQRIDDVVDPIVEKQLQGAQAASAALTEQFTKNLKAANDLRAAMGGVTNNTQFKKIVADSDAATAKLVANQKKVAAAEAERNRLAEKRARIVRESTAADLAAANSTRSETQAITQNTAALAANEATMRRNNVAEIQGEQAAARYRAARLGTTVATAEDTAATVANTAAQSANSNALGNVGRGLTRGLGYLRTLAYVLPGIGIAGIFNLVYEGLSKLFTGGEKFDALIDRFKTLNSLMMDAGAQSGAEIAKVDALFRAINNLDLPLKERNEAVKTLQDMYPEHLSNLTLDNAKTAELTKQYKALKDELVSIAYVQAGYNKIAEVTGRIFDDEFRINEERVKNLQIRQKVNTAQKAENELNASGARNRNANNDALDGGIRKTSQLAQAQGELAKSDKLIFDAAKDREINQARIDLIQKQIDDRVKKSGVGVLGGKQDKEKKVKDTSAEDELRALEYQYNQQIELARALDKDTLELEKEYEKQILNLRKQFYEQQKGDIEDAGLANLEAIQDVGQKELLENEKLYAKGEISKTEYERNKLDIEHTANRDSIEAELSLATQLLDIRASYGEDVSADKKKLSELTRKLAKNDADYEIAKLKEVAEQRKAVNAATKQLAEAAGEFLIELVNAGYTNRKNALRAEQDALEERTQNEINAVDRSLATEQQKADKIAVINAKANSEKERIAKEQRKIDTEKAKFDKAVAIARIIENTAIGITSALASLNVPLAILIGALGAVQLGTVLAQPIPQYAKGTKSAKGGLSIVGERGRELVETPSGLSFLTANTAQMINLPKGSKVTPHHETMRMIGRPENLSKYSGGEVVPWREVIAAIEKNKPTQVRTNVNVKVDAVFYQYRQNHFS